MLKDCECEDNCVDCELDKKIERLVKEAKEKELNVTIHVLENLTREEIDNPISVLSTIKHSES